MTASPYDAPLSDLREHAENLGAWLAIWEARKEPDALARRCASDAVDAMLRDIRQADDATAARADELLRRRAVRTPTAKSASRRDLPNCDQL